MAKFLTEVAREELRNRHRNERDRRVADRIKALMLFYKGWTYLEIAEALMVGEETVSHHVYEYQKCRKLNPENGGSQSKLNVKQTRELITYIETNTYLKAEHICAYVQGAYGVSYTRQGMTDWLHQHGFSYKKPKETSAKGVRKAVFEFFHTSWSRISHLMLDLINDNFYILKSAH